MLLRPSKVAQAATIACTLAACGKVKSAAQSVENQVFAEPTYTPIPGDEPGATLQPATGAQALDAAALLNALTVGGSDEAKASSSLDELSLLDGGASPVVDSATIDYLTAVQGQKSGLKSTKFAKSSISSIVGPQKQTSLTLADSLSLADTTDIKDANYNPKSDTVKVDDASWGGKQEFLISTLGRIAVKDQGQRNTCAAHAGIGQLEYLIVKKNGSDLASIDLSEQRFYMLSRPDLWPKGGGTVDADGGSAWSQGMQTSYGVGGKTAPSTDSKFNIPLETDCPYVNSGKDNELQIPQVSSCTRGAVKVTNLTQTYQTSTNGGPWILHSTSPRSAQEIFDFIKTYDLPVPVGTTLTANWEDNDGMITYAKSTQPGYGPHAGGHAYLIVGARRLDEAKFPGEGGMCFVIKNSWGTGWGTGGFACMTLAWFNNYRDTSFYDVALDVAVDLDYLKKLATPSPPNLPPPQASPPTAPSTPATEPAPKAMTQADPGTPAGGPPAVAANAAPVTPPAPPAPAQTSDGLSLGRLTLPDGRLVQVLFKVSGSTFAMRGIIKGQTASSQELSLIAEGTSLFLDDSAHGKTHVAVGTIANDLITLCAGKYALTCDLKYIKDENRLAIGVSEAEFRRYDADPNASYQSLFTVSGYGVEYAISGIYSDIRLTIGGQPTNPIRLAIKPVSGSILYRGREVGNYQKGQLCSGDFASTCRLLVNKSDRTIKIFFKAQKGS